MRSPISERTGDWRLQLSTHDQWKQGHRSHLEEQHLRVESALQCLKLVSAIMPIREMVDFGCGIGAWLVAAKKLGVETILGVEGKWILENESLVPRNCLMISDLASDRIDLRKNYDLAVTIEVAEHLPESSADLFIENLIRASDHILFSAAFPGQGGLGHLNEQPLRYWVEKFWNRGYVPLDVLRPFIAGRMHIYPWLRLNCIMFVKYDQLLRSNIWMQHARPLAHFSLPYHAALISSE